MGKWKEVWRCKNCGKVYQTEIPEICIKCGERLGTASNFLAMFGISRVLQTDKCEKVIAKRTLLGWKVRSSEDSATQEQEQEQEIAERGTE